MSAIWGCVDLSKGKLEDSIHEKMSRCTSKYKIDKTEIIKDNNVYMACGLQYFTKESYNEILPYSEENLFYTADGVLDDRESLIRELRNCGHKDINEDTPDGQLLFHAWKQWEEDFGKHVIGLFAFAVYNRSNNQFYLYTDHTSSRCINYYIDGTRVYFATLTGSITDAVEGIEISEKWMSGCMSNDFTVMLLFPGLTPFENVRMLGYAGGLKVKLENGEIKTDEIRYWNPLDEIKMSDDHDDEKWKNKFVKVHFDCVKDALRSDGEIGIQLSSGLDSTAVASAAAHMLKEKGKDLYSFTSVPLKDFDKSFENEHNYWIDDESAGVMCLCDRYDNIQPEFLDCDGKSVLTEIEEMCDFLEFPGKALVNHVWILEVYKRAVAKKCKVVLNGAYGNDTISYGDIFSSAYNIAKSGNILMAIAQILRWARKERASRKRAISYFLGVLFKKSEGKIDFLDSTVFKSSLIKKHGIKEQWKKLRKLEGAEEVQSIEQHRARIISELSLQLMGLYDTKNGLYYGLLMRDPTRDKRMLELCLEIPYKCFAWNCEERRLVRNYLKDHIPSKILNMTRRRGRQSGDASERYDKFGLPCGKQPWEVLSDEIDQYFNRDQAISLLKEKTSGTNVMGKARLLACSYFLDKNKNGRG